MGRISRQTGQTLKAIIFTWMTITYVNIEFNRQPWNWNENSTAKLYACLDFTEPVRMQRSKESRTYSMIELQKCARSPTTLVSAVLTRQQFTLLQRYVLTCQYRWIVLIYNQDGKETKVKCYELGKMAAQVAENCRAYVPTSFRLDFSNEMWYWAHHEILGQSVHQDGTTVTVSNQHYEDKKKC